MRSTHLEASTEVEALNREFLARRDALASQLLSGQPLTGAGGLAIGRALAEATDAWILGLWNLACAPELRAHCALFALGGYGRLELAFGSDIDLLIELRDDTVAGDLALSHAVERLMAWCRLARMKLAHAVRTPRQALDAFEEDARSAIALLDARPLEPHRTLDWESADRNAAIAFLRRDDDGLRFVQELYEGHNQRLERHGQTVYLLEPDLKNGQGGLRDLNCVHWAACVRWQFRPGEAVRPELDWNDEQRQTYREALDWLLALRNLLHLEHRRQHDRLNFDDQEMLARTLARQGACAELDAPDLDRDDPVAATEALMRRYYRTARSVSRLCERFVRRWGRLDSTTDRTLGSCFRELDGNLALRPGESARTIGAHQVLEALQIASDEHLLLAPGLELQLEAHVRTWGDAERDDRALNAAFVELLCRPDLDPRTSQRLLELGVLTRLVPEFEPLVCHVQHDVYHVYTTDVHSLKCLEMARSLLAAPPESPPGRWPQFAQIAREIQDPVVFLLAALFHDIGKNRGGGHSQKGAAMMPAIGARLGLRPRQIDQLAFLVREHLTLTHIARRRDITDRRTVRDLAARLRTVETLNQLSALTFCDMSTVGPDVMTDWHATLQLNLHRHLRLALELGVERMWRHREEQVEQKRDAILHLGFHHLQKEHLDDMGQRTGDALNRIDAFVRDLPADHVVASATDALMRQFQAYDEGRRRRGTAIVCTPLPAQGVTEVIVSTDDVPGTLAKISGVLASAGLNILNASIVTTSSSRTLDIFHVQQAAPASSLLPVAEPTPLTDPGRIARLVERLEAVLENKKDVNELLEQRLRETRLAPRPTPAVETSVTELDGFSDTFTVLEIKAQDQLGLLYRITHTLWQHGVSTHLSRIDSVGTQVIDTFYVEEDRGGKLSPERTATLIAALEEVLASADAPPPR